MLIDSAPGQTDRAGNSHDFTSARRAKSRALVAMAAAAFLLSLMGVLAKLASRHTAGAAPIPGSEIALMRYAAGVVSLLVIARITPVNLLGFDRPGLILRGIAGGLAATAFFVGIQTTSLTHATLLNSTNVVWASLIAVFALRERLKLISWTSIAAALVGVALVTCPDLGHVQFGDAISLVSGVLAGLAIVQIRKLRRTESSFAIFFYFNLIGFPVALATICLTHTAMVIPSAIQCLVLIGVGITSVGGQLLMTYGYKELPAAQGSLIILTSVLLSALLSHLLFQDSFTAATIAGGILVLAGAVALSLQPHPPPVP